MGIKFDSQNTYACLIKHDTAVQQNKLLEKFYVLKVDQFISEST